MLFCKDLGALIYVFWGPFSSLFRVVFGFRSLDVFLFVFWAPPFLPMPIPRRASWPSPRNRFVFMFFSVMCLKTYTMLFTTLQSAAAAFCSYIMLFTPKCRALQASPASEICGLQECRSLQASLVTELRGLQDCRMLPASPGTELCGANAFWSLTPTPRPGTWGRLAISRLGGIKVPANSLFSAVSPRATIWRNESVRAADVLGLSATRKSAAEVFVCPLKHA